MSSGLVWLVAAPIVRAPDFGVSVIVTGALGALVAASRTGAAIPAGSAILATPAVAAAIVTGTIDPFVLTNAEHALGFGLGALVVLAWRDKAPSRHALQSRCENIGLRPRRGTARI